MSDPVKLTIKSEADLENLMRAAFKTGHSFTFSFNRPCLQPEAQTDFEEAVAAVSSLTLSHGINFTAALLEVCGAKRLDELPPVQYPKIVKLIQYVQGGG